jgi:hypothetical protein
LISAALIDGALDPVTFDLGELLERARAWILARGCPAAPVRKRRALVFLTPMFTIFERIDVPRARQRAP